MAELDKDVEKGPEPPRKPFRWGRFSLLKRIFFLDVEPFIYHGYRRRLETEDVWHEKVLNTEGLVHNFEYALEKQQVRQKAEADLLKIKLKALDEELKKKGRLPKELEATATDKPAANGTANGHAAANGTANGHAADKNKVAPTPAAANGKPAEAQKGPPGGVPGGSPGGKEKKEKKPKLPKDLQKRADMQKRYDSLTSSVDLKRVIIAGNARVIIFTAILYVLSQACSLAGPLLLQRIVSGLQCFGPTCPPRTELYYYCIGLFTAPFIQALCDNHQTYILFRAGTRMRNALMAAIYRKCLRLSNSSLQAESTGRIVTLMSNDAQKVQDSMPMIHYIWGAPLYIVAVLALLWQQVGWATLVGLAVMLMLGPMSGFLATKLGMLRRSMLQWTDKRVGYMNEVINGIQMIKFYAWEQPFADKVESARSQEARILRLTATWMGVFGLVLFSGPVLVAIFCFGSYTIAGNTLTNASAYTALALFQLLRFPMSFLPMLITMFVNMLVALKRIGGFLARGESELHKEVFDPDMPAGEVSIEHGEFAWDATEAKPTLTDINLQAKPGTLTMIVGGVGSGKSSVLGALVGHMTKRTGKIRMGGSVAYVAQSAWIMNDTLQENVIMGDEHMDGAKYKSALKVSCLGPDLELLPQGDMTEIGDRGVTLSGGQKQRVSIARAVYSNADVYLLDDPLSAVDSHVGRALFEDCIRGPLKSKTVILVTNALQYLPQADNILWMENGLIRAQGTYQKLVEQGLNIAELAHIDEEEESDEETDTENKRDGSSPTKSRVPGPTDVRPEDVRPDIIEIVKEGQRKCSKELRASKDMRRGSKELRASKEFGGGKVTLTRGVTGGNKNLTGVEERESGTISFDVVKRYVNGGGGLPVVITLVILYTLEQGARVYTDRWIGVWFSNIFNQSLAFYLGIYFALGVAYSLITFARSLRFLFMCVNAAVNLHNALLIHILRLPKAFFDTNPAGRILNRFSRDTDIMDNTLPSSLVQFLGCVATYISILIVISIATKWFGIGLVPLTIVYFIIQRYYIPTGRELQRLEAITRSPIYSKFQEALNGVTTIRAYRKEGHFTQVSDKLMEVNADAYLTQKLAAAWLAMRLDLLGLVVLTGCGALLIQGNVDPGLAGLALSYALDLTRFLKQGTNMASKSEADFNSVERIIQYLRPEPEAAPDTPPEVMKLLPSTWPSKGSIHVMDLTMRYRPGLPLVLNGVTFAIDGGEKVGLVGRTGSGKSSIFLALFRMVEPSSGQILIDGVNIQSLGVRHLRSKMSIIPQDPFMFSGTVRTNLDPFEEHDDARLWRVLESVGLKSAISDLDGGLSAKVVDNGNNFSLGQRQLFCMARAMLRDSKILMLDEATASVDVDTDAMIQYAIRTVFASCTLLTIAHRLNTIMDSDKVVVLDAGKVVECAHADDLLKVDNGIFTSMVSQTGKSSARYLRSLASTARMSQRSGIRTLPPAARGGSFAVRRKGSFDESSFSSVSSNPLFKAESPRFRLGMGSARKAGKGEIEISSEEEGRTSSDGVVGSPRDGGPEDLRTPPQSMGGASPIRHKILQNRSASPIGRVSRSRTPASSSPRTASPVVRSPRAGSSPVVESPATDSLALGAGPAPIRTAPSELTHRSTRSVSTPVIGNSPLRGNTPRQTGSPLRGNTPRRTESPRQSGNVPLAQSPLGQQSPRTQQK